MMLERLQFNHKNELEINLFNWNAQKIKSISPQFSFSESRSEVENWKHFPSVHDLKHMNVTLSQKNVPLETNCHFQMEKHSKQIFPTCL